MFNHPPTADISRCVRLSIVVAHGGVDEAVGLDPAVPPSCWRTSPLPAQTRKNRPPSPFCRTRHIRVSEVRPGMKEYGLSVAPRDQDRSVRRGSPGRPAQFQPQVGRGAHQVQGGQPGIDRRRRRHERLARLPPRRGGRGADDRRLRLRLADDEGAVAGVQPIEYMLSIPATKRPATPSDASPATPGTGPAAAGTRDAELSVDQPAASRLVLRRSHRLAPAARSCSSRRRSSRLARWAPRARPSGPPVRRFG